MREVQRVKPGGRRDPLARALEQERVREPGADALEVVVQPPGDDRRLERDEDRRPRTTRDQPLGVRRPVVGDDEDLAWIDALSFDAVRGEQPQTALARRGLHAQPRGGHRLERRSHVADRTRIEDSVGVELGVACSQSGVLKAHLNSAS